MNILGSNPPRESFNAADRKSSTTMLVSLHTPVSDGTVAFGSMALRFGVTPTRNVCASPSALVVSCQRTQSMYYIYVVVQYNNRHTKHNKLHHHLFESLRTAHTIRRAASSQAGQRARQY